MGDLIEVLSPVAEVRPRRLPRAARPGDLTGKVVGFLSNRKPNADVILARIEEMLATRWRPGKVLRWVKPNTTLPAPFVEEIALQCQAVVNALGD
jgi:hypothetical protein